MAENVVYTTVGGYVCKPIHDGTFTNYPGVYESYDVFTEFEHVRTRDNIRSYYQHYSTGHKVTNLFLTTFEPMKINGTALRLHSKPHFECYKSLGGPEADTRNGVKTWMATVKIYFNAPQRVAVGIR